LNFDDGACLCGGFLAKIASPRSTAARIPASWSFKARFYGEMRGDSACVFRDLRIQSSAAAVEKQIKGYPRFTKLNVTNGANP
jgi:hypothetical protein